jgi:DNA-binding transcriptional LysR family regulator
MDEDAVRQQLRQRNLEAFRIVCETGSVTRAAERLNLSQPAVSQLIARIERAFELTLFERGLGKRLKPTASARALYHAVCKTLDAMSDIEATARAIAHLRQEHPDEYPECLLQRDACDA